ncbi:MAG: hypothetical protein AAB462_03410 [Patescibacteria group bacterium]
MTNTRVPRNHFRIDGQIAGSEKLFLAFSEANEQPFMVGDFNTHTTTEGRLGLPFFVFQHLGRTITDQTVLWLPDGFAAGIDDRATVDKQQPSDQLSGFIARKRTVLQDTRFELPIVTGDDGQEGVSIMGILEAATCIDRHLKPVEAWLHTQHDQAFKNADPIKIGGVLVKVPQRTMVTNDGAETKLSRYEHKALLVLAENPNNVCSNEDFAKRILKLNRIRPNDLGEIISRVQRKLDLVDSKLVVTKSELDSGVGYTIHTEDQAE